MLNLMDSVRAHCGDLDPALLDMHFRRLPASYFERYSAADIARHLHLLARLKGDVVQVEVRPLASHAFEILVVGVDHAGTVACITAALATHGFNLEDVQVAPYLATDALGADADGPTYFVILLRVSGNLRGRSTLDLAEELRDRLRVAFTYLSRGNLVEAQAAAADSRHHRTDPARLTPYGLPRPLPESGHSGLLLGSDFRLERRLAVGGMSEVYLATQLSLNRTVAVKLIRQEGALDEDLSARFQQEGLVLGKFSSPRIVQIYAAGTVRSRANMLLGWMAMEYMAGGDLAFWQRQHGCAAADLATRWLRQALEGLSHAHRHAVLHRDLKPHNLLLTAEGDLKVSDFGLLKHVQAVFGGLTPHSAIVGTPNYMSPEQALGEPTDERSDIFSLGTTFFHLLSGRLPFDKHSATAILVQISQEDAPRLAEAAPQVPLPFSTIIGRMMARRREERYQDVGVILEDLASYERRGLLKALEGTPFFPAPNPGGPVPAFNAETRAYQHPCNEADDIVI